MKTRTVLSVLALLAFLSASVGGYLCYSLTGSASIVGVSFPIVVLVVLLYREGKRAIIRDISGRNRAEEEVRKLNEELEQRVIERSAELFESEQRHRSLLQASADPIVVYDMEGRVTYLNPAFTQTFGWTLEELQGEHVDFVPEENWPETKAAIDRMRQGEKVQLFETRRSTKDGSILDIQLSTSLFQDRDGSPAGNIVILRDVTESNRAEEELRQAHHELEQGVAERTSELVRANEQLRQKIEERKQAEEALRGSERQYRNLVDNALVGIYKTDLEGNILYVNEALIKMMEFESLEDMKSVRVLARYSNLEDRDIFIKTLKQTGKINDFEVDLLTKSGGVKNVILTGALEGDSISGMILDITERKQAVEERIRLATAVDQAAESVIISDKRGAIQYVNPAFERISGFTREDIVGRNFRVLKSDTHDEEFYREMYRTISSGKGWAGQIDNRMKDGSLRQFETTISPIRDDSGAIVNFVSVNRDVTQEVALEAQLLQAQKMEAVGTLAGGIAHDFNNLLQVIQGYTEVLIHGVNEDPSHHEALQKIHRSAKRGAELTRQLLTFSRKVQSERRPLDLNQEVEQVKNLLERTIPKMIEIELHLDKAPAIVSADPVQVEQALMNLAVNAMDAMSDGGRIIIETERATLDERFCKTHLGARPGEYVLLTISDTGHGMNKEVVEHVFEPFYTTKEVGKGTGLGLAMVYGIVKTHEGYILCYSELDTGTTFKIYLPALVQGEHWREAGAGDDQLKGGDETILLVDDEKYIRELGVELLTDVGYKVFTATDGEGALELYRKEQKRIDLVILDLVIPGMGGKKCYEEILKINPQAKILIVSGYSVNGPGQEAMEAGAKGFVGKPFDVSHMLTTVRHILDEEQEM
jgi:two-component system cell cycle sensor histidine kinase/response regulator CckA